MFILKSIQRLLGDQIKRLKENYHLTYRTVYTEINGEIKKRKTRQNVAHLLYELKYLLASLNEKSDIFPGSIAEKIRQMEIPEMIWDTY